MDEVKSFEELGRRVAADQDAMLSATDLNEVRQRLFRRTRKPRSRKTTALAGVVLAAALALTSWVFLAPRETVAPLSFQVGTTSSPGTVGEWLSASRGADMPIRFSDGSQIVLDPGARGRVVRVDGHGADVVIESGRTRVAVVPRPNGRWHLSLGPFAVLVTGTRFDVAWRPDEDLLELTLYTGKVNVSGCVFGEGRPVQTGETVRAWCKRNRFEITKGDAQQALESSGEASGAQISVPNDATPVASAARAGGEPLAVAAKEAVRLTAPPPAPSFRQLVKAGRYREAIALANAAGFESECARSGLAELEALGDAARLSGESGKALFAYRMLRKRFPGTAGAGLAAFNIGRLEFDRNASYAESARWFRTYLAEQPSGGLSRDARGRWMEAAFRAGDLATARTVAEQYLAAHPSGPHADLARELISGSDK